MKQRLLLLNVVLAAAICAAGWQLRVSWLAAQQRKQVMFRQTIKPLPAAPLATSSPAGPVSAASYSEIAQKMLFAKDRNPDVVVELQPPPPKPMPPLPVLHGVMYLASGPTAILSDRANPAYVSVVPGENFGEFKVVEVSNDEISLEWDGQVINKRVEELMEQTVAPPPVADTRPTPAANAQRKVETPRGDAAPGVDIGGGLRACQPGDTSAPGTIAQGMRKVVSKTPFGETCRWELLK